MCDDYARFGAAARLTATAGKDLAIRGDRAGSYLGGSLPVIRCACLPPEFARIGIQREQEAVGAGVQDCVPIDSEVAIDIGYRKDLANIIRPRALSLATISK